MKKLIYLTIISLTCLFSGCVTNENTETNDNQNITLQAFNSKHYPWERWNETTNETHEVIK